MPFFCPQIVISAGALTQPERALVHDVFFADGAESVPEVKAASDNQAEADADGKELAVGRQPNHGYRNNQNGGQERCVPRTGMGMRKPSSQRTGQGVPGRRSA